MSKRRIILISLATLIILLPITIFYCNKQVVAASRGKTYTDVSAVPHNHVGLLLGTGKYLNSGYLNPYYKYRIAAAAGLVKAGKVDYLVISGDNSRIDYNEPEMMRSDLIAQGIDSSHIFLDYAGFRTFDSMVRLKEIFSQNKATIISQEFHNQRALFIAEHLGIDAIGFNARDITGTSGLRTNTREKLARVKVFLDYLFNVQPRFLGAKVEIP
jgi:SanA protein